MTSYSEKPNSETYHRRSSSITRRRSSPVKRYRSKSPVSRSRQSKSRSPHYDYHLKRPIPPASRTVNIRYRSRSRSPLVSNQYIRPVFKTREEELARFNPPENNVLAIFGLSKRVIEHDLFDLYKHFGCKECKVIMDKHTGCPKGYGFVYFSRVKDAIIAREKTDGKVVYGKPMRVDFSIGERDYSAISYRSGLYNRDREIRDTRELRYSRSNRYIDHPASNRDHRIPRESINNYYRDEQAHYLRDNSPISRDRHSPFRHNHNLDSYSYSHHRREIERRRVATPPLPPHPHTVSDNYRNTYINQRSRSRTPERLRKHRRLSQNLGELISNRH